MRDSERAGRCGEMKKRAVLVSVNMTFGGSTGRIARALSAIATARGWDSYIAAPEKVPTDEEGSFIQIGIPFMRKVNRRFAMVTGYMDCFSWFATRNFIRKLKRLKPDVLHLHNLHDCYLHLPSLFRYIKTNKIIPTKEYK